MMQENICDAVDCAFLFAARTNEVLFTPEQSEDLKRLVERINRWMQEDGRLKEQESPEFNSFRDGVRAEARDLLRRHGWEGEIDPQLYTYKDPVTGLTIVPNADDAQRRDAVQDQ